MNDCINWQCMWERNWENWLIQECVITSSSDQRCLRTWLRQSWHWYEWNTWLDCKWRARIVIRVMEVWLLCNVCMNGMNWAKDEIEGMDISVHLITIQSTIDAFDEQCGHASWHWCEWVYLMMECNHSNGDITSKDKISDQCSVYSCMHHSWLWWEE